MAPLGETLALVAVVGMVNVLLAPGDPALVSIAPHPTLFITILIVVRYGFFAGVMSAIVCSLAYGGVVVFTADVPTWRHLLSDPYATPVVVLIPVAVLTGMMVQNHLDRRREAEERADKLKDENRTIRDEQDDLRDANVQLADKIVGATATLSTLYKYAQQLNVSDVDQIYDGATQMLREVVDAEVVSVWAKSGALLARSGPSDSESPPPLQAVEAHFDDHGVLVVHEVPERARTALPYLAGRITSGRGGPLEAYLTIDALPFARYNAETFRLFTMTVDWASHSVGKATGAQPVRKPRPKRRGTNLGSLLEDARRSLDQPDSMPGPSAGMHITLSEADRLLGERAESRLIAAADPTISVTDDMLEALENSQGKPLGDLLGQINTYLASERKE